MACEREKTNLELLDLLLEIALYDVWDAADTVRESFGSFSGACPPYDVPIINPAAYPYIDKNAVIFGIVEFLNDLDTGSLSEECENAFAGLLEAYREFEMRVQFKNDVRAAAIKARNRYKDCLHKSEAGGLPD